MPMLCIARETLPRFFFQAYLRATPLTPCASLSPPSARASIPARSLPPLVRCLGTGNTLRRHQWAHPAAPAPPRNVHARKKYSSPLAPRIAIHPAAAVRLACCASSQNPYAGNESRVHAQHLPWSILLVPIAP